MRIGIITLSASDNCGSLLQCYALKQILSQYGETEIINFSSWQSHLVYDIFPKGMRVKKKLKRLPYYTRLLRAKKDYDNFRLKHMEISGKEYFAEDWYEIADKYDIVVTGSDQVWNVQMGDFDEAFFLGWTQSKKVAYAPSLGGRHINQSPDFEKIRGWIEEIQYLSVREEQGKKCLEEVTGRRVNKVLDPTLVLDEKKWLTLVQEPLVKGEYIFYYSWAYCEESTSRIVSEEAKRMGVPVYVIDARKWVRKDPEKWGFKLFKSTGPTVFLNLMRYAKRCYVESFHGMIFAYIFRKNFWLLDIGENLSELDSRLLEIVNLLGMEQRVITKYNVMNIDQSKEIVYSENLPLKEMQQSSRTFLGQIFEGEESENKMSV